MRLEKIVSILASGVIATASLAGCDSGNYGYKNYSYAKKPQISYEQANQRTQATPKTPSYHRVLDDISGVGYNEKIIAVDKTKGMLYLYRRGNSWHLVDKFRVYTGKNPRDKQRDGDKATPETIPQFPYKISRKMSANINDSNYSSHLRQIEMMTRDYGDYVLVLDYPNKRDKILGKTGSGIWIHASNGKNYTRGCIAGSREDIKRLYNRVNTGTKVIIKNQLF